MDASSPDGQPLTMMHEAQQDVVHGPLKPKQQQHTHTHIPEARDASPPAPPVKFD